jgi:hypothetical protein
LHLSSILSGGSIRRSDTLPPSRRLSQQIISLSDFPSARVRVMPFSPGTSPCLTHPSKQPHLREPFAHLLALLTPSATLNSFIIMLESTAAMDCANDKLAPFVISRMVEEKGSSGRCKEAPEPIFHVRLRFDISKAARHQSCGCSCWKCPRSMQQKQPRWVKNALMAVLFSRSFFGSFGRHSAAAMIGRQTPRKGRPHDVSWSRRKPRP